MKVSLPILVLLAAVSPLPVLAADYDPPLMAEETPEYVPVEVGSGWYLRGDIGYNINETPYEFDYLGSETDNTRIFGSLGFGYQFTQYLRGELNVGLLSHDSWESAGASLENTVWSGMANVYADLGTFAGFTPYVGAGAGMVYSRSNAEIGLLDYSDDQYEFAYSLGAGVAYRMSQNWSVDLGYQYLATPGLEYVDVDTLDVEKGIDYHQVKVGLRYELW
jgi:opacity protein-like surface antigen